MKVHNNSFQDNGGLLRVAASSNLFFQVIAALYEKKQPGGDQQFAVWTVGYDVCPGCDSDGGLAGPAAAPCPHCAHQRPKLQAQTPAPSRHGACPCQGGAHLKNRAPGESFQSGYALLAGLPRRRHESKRGCISFKSLIDSNLYQYSIAVDTKVGPRHSHRTQGRRTAAAWPVALQALMSAPCSAGKPMRASWKAMAGRRHCAPHPVMP